MAIPDFQTLMLPLLQSTAQGECRISDTIEQLAAKYALTPEERVQLLPSGRQTTFANRVHWARSHLGKAGLIEPTRRAHFRLTSRGRKVLEAPPDRIDIKFLMQYPEFRAFREASATDTEIVGDLGTTLPVPQVLAPDEQIRSAAKQLDAVLADDLLQRVRSGSPAFFEGLVVRLLIAIGYGGSITDVRKALVGGTGDKGVDGVIDQDPLGLDRIYIQAKRYAEGNVVGAGAIRDFFGSLDRFKATKGLFVTASTFSPAAHETASFLSKRIVLIDGPQLARLMIRHDVGCRVEETVHIKKIDEAFFDPE